MKARKAAKKMKLAKNKFQNAGKIHDEMTAKQAAKIIATLKNMYKNEKFLDGYVKKVMKEFDTDKNGTLDYPEIEKFVQKVFYDFPLEKFNKKSKWGVLKNIMKSDKNKDKSVDMKELRGLIARFAKI